MNPSIDYWQPPVCQNYKSETGCKFGAKCLFRHAEVDSQPDKKQKKSGGKDQLPHERSLYNWVVCLQILIRENLIYGKLENCDQITPSNSPRERGTKLKFGKERAHREELFESVCLMSVVLARQNSGKEHETKLCTKKDAPAEKHGTWRKMSTSSKTRLKLRFTLLLKPGQCWRPLQNLRRNENSWLTPEHRCTC